MTPVVWGQRRPEERVADPTSPSRVRRAISVPFVLLVLRWRAPPRVRLTSGVLLHEAPVRRHRKCSARPRPGSAADRQRGWPCVSALPDDLPPSRPWHLRASLGWVRPSDCLMGQGLPHQTWNVGRRVGFRLIFRLGPPAGPFGGKVFRSRPPLRRESNGSSPLGVGGPFVLLWLSIIPLMENLPGRGGGLASRLCRTF